MKCPNKEIDLGMSNFDHEIDKGFEDAIKAESCFGRYAGWNFNGRVWWDDCFHCEVWTYCIQRETIHADTLNELMEKVSDEYGWE